jgi:hypothetical protein
MTAAARSLTFRVLFALVCTTSAWADSTEMARIKFPAGQEEFDLSPAAVDGTQTLTLAPIAGELQWVHANVGQKFTAGHLLLRFPVAAGESIVAGKPLTQADGSTLFVFSKVTTPSAPATAAAPAVSAAPSIALAPPPATPAPSPAPTNAAPAPMPLAPAVYAAPAPASATPSTIPLAPATSVAGPVMATPPPVAAPAAPPPDADLIAAVRGVLPGPAQMDPLAKADFAIPESPGAAVLDQTTQIIKPGSPRQTVTSLLSNFGQGGALKSGFSIAITPYTMLRAKPVGLREYNDSEWARFMTRLQLSFAAKNGDAPAGSTTSPALFGIGVSGLFFDNADPRLDQAMIQKLKNLFSTSWGNAQTAQAIALGQQVTAPDVAQTQLDAYREITQAAARTRWNAAASGFGYAVRLNSASGKAQDAKYDGGAGWLNLSAPGFGSLEPFSQFLFTAAYRDHDSYTRNGISGIENSFNFAGQFRFGTADTNGFVQAAHHWHEPVGAPRLNDTTVELGFEHKVVEGLWLSLSWTNDKSMGGNSAVKTGLRYGFGQGATIGDMK